MAQNFTSAATSINGKQGKLPAFYSSFTFPVGSTIVDYGCGDEPSLMKQKAEDDGAIWFGYDKYNQPDHINWDAMDTLWSGVDYALCCNVLNVIDDDNEIKRIIKLLVEHSTQTVFQVYQGDKSGVGRQTGSDQWQRNDNRKWYEDIIKSLGYNITKATGNYIYVDKKGN